MNTKQQSIKYFILILLIAVLVTPAIALASWWNPLSWNIGSWFKSPSQVQIQKQPTPQIVGNDRDSHGCIGSAGYTWCALKNKCLRTWEEKCEVATQNQVVCTMDAKLCPDGSAVGRTGPKCEFAPCPTTDQIIDLNKISLELMNGYLSQYKSTNFPLAKRLTDYKINSLTVNSFDEKNQCFFFSVDYSVEAAIKPEVGNRDYSDWVAGNGLIGTGNWINNKSNVFNVIKKDGKTYEISGGGTGAGSNECSATPDEYFTPFSLNISN